RRAPGSSAPRSWFRGRRRRSASESGCSGGRRSSAMALWARKGTICYRPSATVPLTWSNIHLAVALLLAGAMGGQPSLTDAVLYGRTADVKQLIADGADVNAPDDSGMTPLMIAASQGETAIARTLIAARADVSATAPDKTTALMHAASANRG